MTVAVVGCGRWGRNHVRTFASLGALAAVVDADPELAQREAGIVSVKALSLETVLEAKGITAMVIATPAITHEDLAIRALEAGKDVLIEKPFAVSIRGAERLVMTARRCGRVLMAGHLLRYHPAFESLLTLVRGGRLGALRYAVSTRSSLGVLRTSEDVFSSFAPHDVSMLQALFGAEPERVSASGRAYVTRGVADEVHAELAFAGHRRAQILVSWLSPLKEQKLVVVGEEAAAVFDDTRPWPEKLTLRDFRIHREGDEPRIEAGDPSFVAIDPDPPLRRECAHFLSRCEDRGAALTGPEEALAVQRTLSAIGAEVSRSLTQPIGPSFAANP